MSLLGSSRCRHLSANATDSAFVQLRGSFCLTSLATDLQLSKLVRSSFSCVGALNNAEGWILSRTHGRVDMEPYSLSVLHFSLGHLARMSSMPCCCCAMAAAVAVAPQKRGPPEPVEAEHSLQIHGCL